MCLSEFSWSRASRGGTVLLRSIAPRLEDDPPHLVGDQVARVAAGDDEGTKLGRCDLEPPLGARIEPRPMRRAARRHETHFGELELLPQLIGGAEVPAVNRIEGAAEDADRLHGFRPPAHARARACARRSAPRARA